MLQSNFSALIDDRPEENLFRVHRRIYTDQDVFDAEMERIFEQSWTYVCHESQIPKPGDYYAVRLGREPVLINRRDDGSVKRRTQAARKSPHSIPKGGLREPLGIRTDERRIPELRFRAAQAGGQGLGPVGGAEDAGLAVDDGLQRAARSERDDRRPARLRLARHNAEVLLPGQQERAAALVEGAQILVGNPTEETGLCA